jgi:RNA recognition motif-containing protein
MKLWIGNIAPDTSDDELRDFVKKYAPALECGAIERVEGAGNRPAAMLHFPEANKAALDNLRHRLNGMYWKSRALVCTIYMF